MNVCTNSHYKVQDPLPNLSSWDYNPLATSCETETTSYVVTSTVGFQVFNHPNTQNLIAHADMKNCLTTPLLYNTLSIVTEDATYPNTI